MYSTLKLMLLGAAFAAAAPAGYNTTLTQRSTVSFPPNSTNATAPTNSTRLVDPGVGNVNKVINDLIRKIFDEPEVIIVTPPVPTNGTAPTNSTQPPTDLEGTLKAIDDWLEEILRPSKKPPVLVNTSSNGTIPPQHGDRSAKLTSMLNDCNIDGYAECQSSLGEDCDAELLKSGECRLHDFVKALVAQGPKVPEGAMVFGDGEILRDGKVIGNMEDLEWSTDA